MSADDYRARGEAVARTTRKVVHGLAAVAGVVVGGFGVVALWGGDWDRASALFLFALWIEYRP